MTAQHDGDGSPGRPDVEALRANKREMFDGMRAYHQSELSHANYAITMLLAVAAAAGAVIVAITFPQHPVEHQPEIVWGLVVAVAAITLTISITATSKIGADHATYALYGREYMATCRLLGFYEKSDDTKALKTSTTIGQGSGYRKTQQIIWAFAGVLNVLVLAFALMAGTLAVPGGGGTAATRGEREHTGPASGTERPAPPAPDAKKPGALEDQPGHITVNVPVVVCPPGNQPASAPPSSSGGAGGPNSASASSSIVVVTCAPAGK